MQRTRRWTYWHPAARVCVNGHPSIAEEYSQSPMVFVGHAARSRVVPESKNYNEGMMYTVIVDEGLRV